MSIRRIGALVALAFLLAACSAGPGTGGTLEGSQWVLASYDQQGTLVTVPETLYADASFASARVDGFSGCNEYQSLYVSGGRTLVVSRPSASARACDQASMDFEQRYLELLQQGRLYSVRRDTLTMFDGQGNTVLVFDAAPRNPLLGKWLVASYGTEPGTVVGVLPSTQLDVTFGIASVGGFGGCNSFSGTYGTNGEAVRISRLATTQMACAQDVMDQETAFLKAFQGVSLIDPRGSQLNLTDLQGRSMVMLVRPDAVPSPSPSPSASSSPTASASPSPSPSPSASPSPSPSPPPSPSPSPSPAASASPAPSAAASAGPSASAPASMVPTASCKLGTTAGTVATIVYPGAWYTLAEPADLACRYFDPAPITVPADPTTLRTAVTAGVLATPYQEAVTAATDPAKWTVSGRSEFNLRGVAVTCVAAISRDASTGVTVGYGRYACLANVQSAGTVVLQTSGPPSDGAFRADAAVVSLMTAASTFTPPG